MMQEWALVIAVLGLGTSIIAVVKFWVDVGVFKKTAANAESSAGEAHRRVDALTTALADYKVMAGREFATSSDIAVAERRFAEAVDGLRKDFNRMADRFDNLVDKLIKREGAV